MLRMSGQIFLSAVTLFLDANVTNNLTNYIPQKVPASFYFYNLNKSNVPIPVERDDIFFKRTLFPRCCQLQTLYDIDNKGCAANNNSSPIYQDLGMSIDLIQSGLAYCSVVVDRFVETKNFRLEDGDATLKIDDEYVEKGQFCIDKTLQHDDIYVVRLCKNVSYCSSVDRNDKNEWCVHKCCSDGYQSVDYKCTLNDRMGIHVKNHSKVYARTDGYGMMYGGNVNCPTSVWKEYSEVNAQIRADGVLIVNNSPREYKINDYCLSTNYDTSTGQISNQILYCEFRQVLYVKWKFNEIATVITCISFALTIAIYIFVYRLKQLREQLICCFCLVDLTFWVTYSMRIFDVKFGKFCIPFAYIYYFLMISRLSWLNVFSFDVWKSTTSPVPNIGIRRKTRFYKKMIYYTTYAVLIPLICTMFFILGNKDYYSLGRFKPLITKITCYIDLRKIDGNLGLLHLYIPVTILILINIGLFVKTVIYFLHTKKNVSKFADSSASRAGYQKNKKKIIIVKLALIMGITWIYYLYTYLNNIQNNETAQHIGDIIGFANTFEGVYFLLIVAVNWRKVKMYLQNKNLLPRAFMSNPVSVPHSTKETSVPEST